MHFLFLFFKLKTRFFSNLILRIKRGTGNNNSWETRGYALRVRRGREEEEEPLALPLVESEAYKDNVDNNEQQVFQILELNKFGDFNSSLI